MSVCNSYVFQYMLQWLMDNVFTVYSSCLIYSYSLWYSITSEKQVWDTLTALYKQICKRIIKTEIICGYFCKYTLVTEPIYAYIIYR